MEKELTKDLSLYRFKKAQDFLDVAIELFKEERFGHAQNRAYYALFTAIRSVTALAGFDSSKHSGVIAFFNQYYVKTGIFKPETSNVIRTASMFREKSDYEDFYVAEKDDTENLIQVVTGFIIDVKNYLMNQQLIVENKK